MSCYGIGFEAARLSHIARLSLTADNIGEQLGKTEQKAWYWGSATMVKN